VLLKNTPTFNLEAVLKFMTFNGAKALNVSDKFGRFIVGKNTGLNLISEKNNQLTFTKKIA
jgi:cytosine/adenosine deaminase-related metal-dependent hydrolase